MAAVERQLHPALLLFLVLLLLAVAAEGQLSQLQYASCDNVTQQTNDSFTQNFNALGVSLRQMAAEGNSHYSTSSTIDSMWVTGMYECRGDLSVSECSECVTAATGHYCSDGYNNGIRVQLLGCYFDVEKWTAATTTSYEARFQSCSTRQNNDPQYQSDLSSALTQSATQAPDNTSSYFSFATIRSANALSQCFSSLFSTDCTACLSQISNRSSTCGNSSSGSFYYASCYYLFSDNVLYFSNTSVDASNVVKSVGNSSPPGGSGKKSSSSVGIIVGIVVSVAFLLVIITGAYAGIKYWKGKSDGTVPLKETIGEGGGGGQGNVEVNGPGKAKA